MIYQSTNVLSLAASTNQSNVIVGKPGYFITSISVTVNPNAGFTGAAIFAIGFSDSSKGAIWNAGDFFVPNTFSSPPGIVVAGPTIQTPSGFCWTSSQSGSALSIIFSPQGIGALINISYGYTAFLNF